MRSRPPSVKTWSSEGVCPCHEIASHLADTYKLPDTPSDGGLLRLCAYQVVPQRDKHRYGGLYPGQPLAGRCKRLALGAVRHANADPGNTV